MSIVFIGRAFCLFVSVIPLSIYMHCIIVLAQKWNCTHGIMIK